jgi:hypothetical protein
LLLLLLSQAPVKDWLVVAGQVAEKPQAFLLEAWEIYCFEHFVSTGSEERDD